MAKKIVNKQLKMEPNFWKLKKRIYAAMASQLQFSFTNVESEIYTFQTMDLCVGHPVNAWIHKGEQVNCLKLEFPLDGRIFMADWSVDLQSFQRAS